MPKLNYSHLVPIKPLSTVSIVSKRSFPLLSCNYSNLQRRQDATNTSIPPNAPQHGASVAVLGGGITGLVTTYRLSQKRPDLRIRIFESSNRLGGWLHSTSVDVGTGKVVFELGPRNLRPAWPNGHVTLNLVDELGLSDRLLTTSKYSPAAQNRFIYYPDHLVRMPGPGLSLWGNVKNLVQEPVFDGFLEGLRKELWAPKRSPDVQDESIGSFISRRCGPALADNIVSAVFHGIYAGDIYKLSARSIMPLFWRYEGLKGSVIASELDAWVKGVRPIWSTDLDVAEAIEMHPGWRPSEAVMTAQKSSVFTFKEGVGELANRLEGKLEEELNVRIQKGTTVDKIEMKGHGRNAKIEIITHDSSDSSKNKEIWECSHVVSTLPARRLSRIVSKQTPLYSLSKIRAVTVMVVNLFYRNPSLIHTKGFGYLLPRSLPFDQNPERALGVIFDSDSSIGQDMAEGTKLTVMLGGHWWDDFDSFPTSEKGVSMARAVLNRHLGITDTPQAVRVGLQKDCIPQYEVGHDQRMEQASRELEAFDGRLTVAGSSYTGVGLNDCVRAAADCVSGLLSEENCTGLEQFMGKRRLIWVRRE